MQARRAIATIGVFALCVAMVGVLGNGIAGAASAAGHHASGHHASGHRASGHRASGHHASGHRAMCHHGSRHHASGDGHHAADHSTHHGASHEAHVASSATHDKGSKTARVRKTHGKKSRRKVDVVAGVFSTRGAACTELELLGKHGFHGFRVKKKPSRTTSSAAAGTHRSPIRGRHGPIGGAFGIAGGSSSRPGSFRSSRTVGAGGTSTAGVRFKDVKAFATRKRARRLVKRLRHHGHHATIRKVHSLAERR